MSIPQVVSWKSNWFDFMQSVAAMNPCDLTPNCTLEARYVATTFVHVIATVFIAKCVPILLAPVVQKPVSLTLG